MNNGLRQRIEKLEQRAGHAATVLTMGDGSERSVRSDRRHWARLYAGWCQRSQAELDGLPEPTTPVDAELNAIRDAVSIRESDGELFNLLHIMLVGPVETDESDGLILLPGYSDEGEENEPR